MVCRLLKLTKGPIILLAGLTIISCIENSDGQKEFLKESNGDSGISVNEKLPISDKVAPYTLTGEILTFAKKQGVNPSTTYYSFHTIESLVNQNCPSLSFFLSEGTQGTSTYWQGEYKVIYITKPLLAKYPSGVTPTPLPPLYGFASSDVFVIGSLNPDGNNTSNAPKLTPWISLSKIAMYRKPCGIPEEIVITVDSKECPDGWKEYTPAYGRFIRGIDKSGKNIDPEGVRPPGNTQKDLVGMHVHQKSSLQYDTTHIGNQRHYGGGIYSVKDIDTKPNRGIETRPKNVSLLYCKKISKE